VKKTSNEGIQASLVETAAGAYTLKEKRGAFTTTSKETRHVKEGRTASGDHEPCARGRSQLAKKLDQDAWRAGRSEGASRLRFC